MARASRRIRYRPLRLTDYEAVIGLLAACDMNPHTRGRESPTAFARQRKAHPTTYLGAFEGDLLVGCVFGTHDARKAFVNRLAVRPGYRRRGIATRLVRECEKGLRRQGMEMFCAMIETENRASRRLFERLGYEVWTLWYARRKRHRDV